MESKSHIPPLQEPIDLHRPVAWITGGTRGLGRALANVLVVSHDLVLSYRADDANANIMSEGIQEKTGRAPMVLRGDLSRDGVAEEQMQQIVRRYGRLDGLIHCAALATFKSVLSLRPRELRRALAYSFEAFHEVVLATAPALCQTRGSIVVVSSQAARKVISGYAGLGAAKAALESYSRHLAAEMGPMGVRVNIVSPGVLRTTSLSRMGLNTIALDEIERRTPLVHLVTKQEVADVIRFLLSSAASAITGQTITIDAGYEILA